MLVRTHHNTYLRVSGVSESRAQRVRVTESSPSGERNPLNQNRSRGQVKSSIPLASEHISSHSTGLRGREARGGIP